jgi:hypothetical protein
MDPEQLRDRALDAAPDSAERILLGAALFDTLTDDRMVLVGGGAQVTHTGIGRITDIDVVGVVSEHDAIRLAAAGFHREGRHWVLEGEESAIAVEVPADRLTAEEETEVVDLGGATVEIISVTDLMMDRLVQATDGAPVTHDEAVQLAIAAHDRIDWDRLMHRAADVARAEPFLGALPALAAAMREAAAPAPK